MTKREIEIGTGDGTVTAGLFLPAGAVPRAGVILYMDIFGPRPALDGMAERYASIGYAVLLPDLFYRDAPYGPFDPATAFGDPPTREKMMALRATATNARMAADTAAYLDAFDAAGVTGPVGTVGYCMGGAYALTAAAAHADRVVAAASLHGGGLASEAEDSPHLRANEIRGRVYVGTAEEDRSFPPEQSARLAQALREAGVDHVIENYRGCSHGWCVPDHGVYDRAGAERHWQRMAVFFGETLV